MFGLVKSPMGVSDVVVMERGIARAGAQSPGSGTRCM